MVKITDKIQSFRAENPSTSFFSFEYFPPKTEAGVTNLYNRVEKMAQHDPLWVDVTWGAGGSSAGTTQELCENFGKFTGLDVLMHLTCTNVTIDETRKVLDWCKEKGICNILALRGDPPAGIAGADSAWKATDGGFGNAVDLVRFMRSEYGDYFCIGVAAYPEGHMDNKDKKQDFLYFKEKVEAGADFAVTQLFYDNNLYFEFVQNCRDHGLTLDVFPGLMPIQSYGGFKRMTDFCSTYVPQEVTDALEPIQNDDEAVKKYGIELGVRMGRDLLARGAPGLHLYTLNLETTAVAIVKKLGLVDEFGKNKAYPWFRPAARRAVEDVRPVYWSQRSRSYVERTSTWDDFPNGRFGNRDSPAYGEFDYYRAKQPQIKDQQKAEWKFENLTGLCEVFVKFLSHQGVKSLPWCSQAPGAETVMIQNQLLRMCKAGLLPINSQPRVNGALSTDQLFGWGPKGGVVYQKAYVEFFCSPRKLAILEKALNAPTLEYVAVSKAGEVKKSFAEATRTTAVTWGIFPGKEVQQPTVVDLRAFLAWKEEAFALWAEWEAAIEAEEPKRVLHEIQEEWYLVSVVDNDFLSGDVFNTMLATDLAEKSLLKAGA